MPIEGAIEFVESDDVPPVGMLDDRFELHCETCGEGLAYGGRGRKPRFCEEHKPGRSSSATSAVKNTKQDLLITTAITGIYQLGGAAVAMPILLGRPDVGEIISAYAEPIAEAWVDASKTNTALRKTLNKLADQSGMATVVALHASMAFAVYTQMSKPYEVPSG